MAVALALAGDRRSLPVLREIVRNPGCAADLVENLRVVCAKVGDSVTGAANLLDWTVKVDGVVVSHVAVNVCNGFPKFWNPAKDRIVAFGRFRM